MNAGPEGKCVCNFLHSCQRRVRAGLGGAYGQERGPRGSPVPGSDLASTQPRVAGCGSQGRAGPWPPAQELPGGASGLVSRGLVWLGVCEVSEPPPRPCLHVRWTLFTRRRGGEGWGSGWRGAGVGGPYLSGAVVLGVTVTVSLGGRGKGGRGRWGVGGRTRCPRGYCGRRTQGGERCPAGLQP